MFRGKNTNDSHVKNDIFEKVRKCPFYILNILQKKDQNIYFTSDLRKR